MTVGRSENDPDNALEGENGVTERQRVLEQTFNLSPETARLTAEDSVSGGMRNPASDAVDEAREAEAKATEPRK